MKVLATGSPLPDSGFGLRVSSFGFRVSGAGCRVPDSRFQVPGFGFRVPGFGFGVPGFAFRVPGFGFRGRDRCRWDGVQFNFSSISTPQRYAAREEDAPDFYTTDQPTNQPTNQPHRGLQRQSIATFKRVSVTVCVGNLPFLYGIAYRRVYGLFH